MPSTFIRSELIIEVEKIMVSEIEEWNAAMGWFGGLSTPLQIAYLIIGIIIAVGVVYLIIQLLKAVFWLVYQVIKLTLYLHVLLAYSMIWLFIIMPFELIFSNKRMSEIWAEFKKNFKAITATFYPPAKKNEALATPAQPIAAPAATYIIISAATAQAAPSTPPKVKIAQTPQAPVVEGIKYHCSNCGQEFSRSMGSLLAQKGQAYCEHCGQAYGMEGQIPYPINA